MSGDDSHLPITPVAYSIAGCSEHSGRYVAENILIDNPMDQGSRWSGAYQASNIKQWMLLKLDCLSVLRTLTFGKFHRAHPCNMKEFKLFVGETEESMIEVLHAGLRNDHVAETFSIRHVNSAGVPFPTRAHGQSFHVSIWHVRMTGIMDETFVEQARIEHEEYKESMILRHILKHLRQRRLLTPYQSILSRTSLGPGSASSSIEHPTVTSLHSALVLRGKFSEAESLLSSCAADDLFSSSILSFQPTAAWSRINSHNDPEEGVTTQPSPRGGHAMCLDRELGHIYMFGGWDGKKSLHDFWMWSIKDLKWTFLGSNGPAPRACHKVVFDDTTGDIFLFGRLDENVSSEHTPSPTSAGRGGHRATSSEPPAGAGSSPGPSPSADEPPRSTPSKPSTFCAEFFRYRTRGPQAGEWEIVSSDTQAEGGPPLVFDHQMVIDNERRMIYVSGGRVVDGDWDSVKYSGLYSYNMRTGKWKALQATDSISVHPSIPSRFGHSMVLDHDLQTLFIFAGQRDDKYLADMYAYHIPTDAITELYSNFAASDGPDACFTQRAVIDPKLKEIYIFCGLTKGPPGALSVLESEAPYWIYRYQRPERPGIWTKILPSASSIPPTSAHIGNIPLPRYAHQVVYDAQSKTVYMHGGNAGLEKEVGGSVGEDADGEREGRREGEREDSVVRETRYRIFRGDTTAGGGDADGGHETDSSEDSDGAGDRLDDFWSMQLQRPSSAEIVRRGKYLIRQQQFREMCEDASPVKALTYLQTEVSSVVDHSDPDEAKEFRSLLSHLLTPAPRPASTSTLPERPESVTQKRKRSPDSFGEGTRTVTRAQVHDGDEPMGDVTDADTSESSHPVVSFEPDPEERLTTGQLSPSSSRYKQRSSVFEKLMTFVNEEARQPEQNLWDMIDVDQLEEKQ